MRAFQVPAQATLNGAPDNTTHKVMLAKGGNSTW
jgi:hypothetical protein